MTRMYNPAHPGEVLREYLGDLTVTEAAVRLRITRAALSRILNGTNGISADMALRLQDALGTSAEMWLGMQKQHELWVAGKKKRPKVTPLLKHVTAGLNLIGKSEPAGKRGGHRHAFSRGN